MNAATQSILVDLFNLALLMLAIGLPAYAWIRRGNPTAAWERAGNVWTGPFISLDLVVVVALVLGARAMAVGFDGPGPPESYTAGSILGGSMFFVIISGAILLTLVVRRAHLTEVFGLDRLSGKAMLAWTAGGTAVAVGGVMVVAWAWQKWVLSPSWAQTGEQTMITLLRESPDMKLRLAIVATACVIQPVTEEIIFRGYFYPAIKRHADRPFAALVSSLVFAALHLHVPTLAPLFLLGVLLVVAYEWSGSLWVPIGIHALFNTMTVVHQITLSAH